MNSSRKYISPTVVIIFALLVAPLAQATNGYFKIGYTGESGHSTFISKMRVYA